MSGKKDYITNKSSEFFLLHVIPINYKLTNQSCSKTVTKNAIKLNCKIAAISIPYSSPFHQHIFFFFLNIFKFKHFLNLCFLKEVHFQVYSNVSGRQIMRFIGKCNRSRVGKLVLFPTLLRQK